MSDYISKQDLLDWLQAHDQTIPFSNLRRIIAAGKFDASDQGEVARFREALEKIKRLIEVHEECRPYFYEDIMQKYINLSLVIAEPVGAQQYNSTWKQETVWVARDEHGRIIRVQDDDPAAVALSAEWLIQTASTGEGQQKD